MVGAEVAGLIAHQLFERDDRSARVAVLAEGIGLTGPRRERPSIRRSQELGHARKELLELGQGAGGVSCDKPVRGQSLARREGLEVIGAEDSLRLRHDVLECLDGSGQVTDRRPPPGEAVAHAHGVGMIRPELRQCLGKELLDRRQGARRVARLALEVGDLVAGDHDVRVRAEQARRLPQSVEGTLLLPEASGEVAGLSEPSGDLQPDIGRPRMVGTK